MKIIITEEQYKLLFEMDMTEDNLYRFLYSLWDKQKKMGEEPHLVDVIYDVTGVVMGSREDYQVIRPIWYEYNGGFDKLSNELKKEIEKKKFTVEEREFNLLMDIIINDVVIDYDDLSIEVGILIIDGMVDGFITDDDGTQRMERMSIFDQIYELEYDNQDFKYYLEDSVRMFFINKLKKYGIPIFFNADF